MIESTRSLLLFICSFLRILLFPFQFFIQDTPPCDAVRTSTLLCVNYVEAREEETRRAPYANRDRGLSLSPDFGDLKEETEKLPYIQKLSFSFSLPHSA
jgi:hypothetical protein